LNGHGSFAANNGNLYVFGGFDDANPRGYNPYTYIYNFALGSWTIGNNMTTAVGYFGSATDGNRFYVVGGTNGATQINYLQIYDISSGVWSINNGSVYPEGISFDAVVFLDGSLHSIGGSNDSGYISANRIASLCGVYAFNGQCDDENQCNFDDTCQSNGTCIGTSICVANDCQVSTCNSTIGNCVIANLPNGTLCDNNNKCITCSNGECTGQIRCSDSTCDPTTGQCSSSNTNTSPATSSNSNTSPATSVTASYISLCYSTGAIVGILIFLLC